MLIKPRLNNEEHKKKNWIKYDEVIDKSKNKCQIFVDILRAFLQCVSMMYAHLFVVKMQDENMATVKEPL